MQEIWKKIPGYEGLYECSNLGRIKSLPRNGTIKLPKILSDGKKINGYISITLSKNDIKKNYSIHRIVLETFIGRCPQGMEACHYNGKKNDNRLENLRWDTKENNTKDNIRLGKIAHNKGEKSGKNKLREKDILFIKNSYRHRFFTQRFLAKKFDVHPSTINSIIKGKNWKHIS